MANVIRWDPLRSNTLRELEEINERFNRFFGRQTSGSTEGNETMTVADWMPTVDIAEDDKEYLIKVEIPEVDKKDVKVTIQEGVLMIQGERKKESREDKGKRFHRLERVYGTFQRSFTLPEDVADDKINAEFKDGMLYIHLPKTEKPKPKQVEVKVA